MAQQSPRCKLSRSAQFHRWKLCVFCFEFPRGPSPHSRHGIFDHGGGHVLDGQSCHNVDCRGGEKSIGRELGRCRADRNVKVCALWIHWPYLENLGLRRDWFVSLLSRDSVFITPRVTTGMQKLPTSARAAREKNGSHAPLGLPLSGVPFRITSGGTFFRVRLFGTQKTALRASVFARDGRSKSWQI